MIETFERKFEKFIDYRLRRGRGDAVKNIRTGDEPTQIELVELSEIPGSVLKDLIENFERDYDNSQDRVVNYTQKTHDQIHHLVRNLLILATLHRARVRDLEEDIADRLQQLEGMIYSGAAGSSTKALPGPVDVDRAATKTITTRKDVNGNLVAQVFDRSLHETLANLSLRLERLEQGAKGFAVYRGVWREQEYHPGDMVTCHGSVWHCDHPTRDRPGDGARSWTLAVKSGVSK